MWHNVSIDPCTVHTNIESNELRNSTGKPPNWNRLRRQLMSQLVGLFQLKVATSILQYEFKIFYQCLKKIDERYSLTIILVSAPTSCFTFAVPMREVSCVGYTLRAWDLRSLQFILYVPLYFRRVVMNS